MARPTKEQLEKDIELVCISISHDLRAEIMRALRNPRLNKKMIAARAGMSQAHLSVYINKTNGSINVSTLVRLALAIDRLPVLSFTAYDKPIAS